MLDDACDTRRYRKLYETNILILLYIFICIDSTLNFAITHCTIELAHYVLIAMLPIHS